MSLTVFSPAKINLFLYVTGVRDDGFHDLFTLMVPIDLEDRIVVEFAKSGIHVSCDHPDVPDGDGNLAWMAANLFFLKYRERVSGNPPFGGVKIRINKSIPVGGGLGGGSSNAAAVLTTLNRSMGNRFTQAELEGIALALGSDVPFFIRGGAAVASGRGEELAACADLPEFWVLLCCPEVFASTAAVFKNLDYRLTLGPGCTMNTGSNVLPLGQEVRVWENLHNDLEEPACRLYPEIARTKADMESLLGQKAFMSGSGSCLFALFPDRDEAVAGEKILRRAWSGRRKSILLARAMHSEV